jgi:hypothetical protein
LQRAWIFPFFMLIVRPVQQYLLLLQCWIFKNAKQIDQLDFILLTKVNYLENNIPDTNSFPLLRFLQQYLLLLSLVTGFLSSLVLLLLSQWWTPPLRLQVSDCSTFLMMCHVPSMAVFCRESTELLLLYSFIEYTIQICY